MSEGQAKLKAVNQSTVKYGCESKIWQELTDSISYCIVKDMIPIYAVEEIGYKTLLKSFDLKYEVPSR